MQVLDLAGAAKEKDKGVPQSITNVAMATPI